MILGEAAGTAAGMALEAGISLSSVGGTALQAKLLSYGGIFSVPGA
jgi:hypothetical protein